MASDDAKQGESSSSGSWGACFSGDPGSRMADDTAGVQEQELTKASPELSFDAIMAGLKKMDLTPEQLDALRLTTDSASAVVVVDVADGVPAREVVLDENEEAEENAFEIVKNFSVGTYLSESCQYYKENPIAFKKEVLSGLTVAVMQVPESVAFSFVAGVDPLCGLYSTVFLGFITAVMGGKPGMISGAAGAMAVVIKDLMMDDGPLKTFDTKASGARFDEAARGAARRAADRVRTDSPPVRLRCWNECSAARWTTVVFATPLCPSAPPRTPRRGSSSCSCVRCSRGCCKWRAASCSSPSSCSSSRSPRCSAS